MSSATKNVILESGQICALSGEYETVGSISTTIFVSKGELMPEYCGKKVKWILVKKRIKQIIMKTFKLKFVEFTSYFFILLFCYASLSKIL
ncbi:hypothetical protein [Chryseobacterium indoltheticum]|uniref:hypothetical protein n=1 Tax=Chryseobacterium indoltheticum TaxID=254 RepID=UPI003F4982D6